MISIEYLVGNFLVFSMLIAVIWLSKLYVGSHTYVRDIHLILAGMMNMVWNIVFLLFCKYGADTFVPPLVSLGNLQFLLVCLFIMGNISTSPLKWVSNIFCSFSLLLVIYACVYQNLIFNHVIILTIGLITLLYMIWNENDKINIISFVSVWVSVFICMYTTFTAVIYKHRLLQYFVVTTDIVMLSLIYYRIRMFRKALGIEVFHFLKNKETEED